MKKLIFVALTCALCVGAYAQTAEEFLARYNSLVKRVGYAGAGVETLINKWELAAPSDINQMVARFNYFFDKSRTSVTTIHPGPKYLGVKPSVTLKDSTGADVNYYSEYLYEKEVFDQAIQVLDDAIESYPNRLELCVLKADALMAYEKGTPSVSAEYIKGLIDMTFAKKHIWGEEEQKLTDQEFLEEIQSFCCVYFQLETPEAYKAMKDISTKVLKYSPKSVEFIDNMGAYCAKVEKNDKKALKYFQKSLSIDPDDIIANQNKKLIERRAKLKK